MELPSQLICRTCGELKPITSFPKCKTNKFGVKAQCLNPCYKEKNKKYYLSIKGETWKARYGKKNNILPTIEATQ